MRGLSQDDLSVVSGGTNGFNITLDVNVPTADLPVIQDLLVKLFTGQLNLDTFSNALSSSASSFDSMPVTSILIAPN
ncbi:MAG: hypothetical protein BGO43_15420 [Gammaproteobacteria bacterium 39-13]|nr:hypothetical protein [Gammaproteobacteria bacterium]OJV87804.1 MAG: hypothetical protein BGO43_15420 [Gammaproteobacteria bacterium 39-13]